MIPRLSSGTPGKYLETGSFTDSLPCISSFRIAAAVNCLVMDPMSNCVSSVNGCFFAWSARP